MLLLLQLKVVWGAWDARDMTTGDTAGYYISAWRWYEKLTCNIAWSPLYTAFYGSFHFLTQDVQLATVLHRLVIVCCASLLVLALFRRLLPPGLAWLAAAWWAVLPINFNALYEVHLFALLPVLAVWLLVQSRDSPFARGAALAALALATLLVRNELAVATGLLTLVCAIWEYRRWLAPSIGVSEDQARPSSLNPDRYHLTPILAGYLAPLGIAAVVVGVTYQRSIVKFPELWTQTLRTKHTLNMAQVYSIGYQQRHPEWPGNMWVAFHALMRRDFGKDTPSFGEMIRANPRAVADHILWNYRLAPNGLQVLLFNSAWGKRNPDYAPIRTRSRTALVLSLLLLAVWAAGITLALKERFYWYQNYLRGRLLTWLAMLCVAAVAVPVIATQRPRPSYLFPLGVLIMGLTGLWVHILVHRLALVKQLSVLMPAVMVGLFLFVPSFYLKAARRPQSVDGRTDGQSVPPRRLLSEAIEQLRPYQALIADPKTHFLKGEFCFEVSSYLGHGLCRPHDYGLLDERPASQPLSDFLESRDINLMYLDENLLYRLAATDPVGAQPFLGNTGDARWTLVACQDVPGQRWKLFRRVPYPVNERRTLHERSATSHGGHKYPVVP
jgi:hypothetical protein